MANDVFYVFLYKTKDTCNNALKSITKKEVICKKC